MLLYTVDNISIPLDLNSFGAPPPIGNVTPNTGAFTTLSATGAVTFGSTLTVAGQLTLNNTGAAKLSVGTTAQRPTAVTGMVRYNSTTGKFEGYGATAWGALGGGATGGGADQVFVENGQIVTTNYTLSTGFNAMSVGPITVNSGITVTVPSGARWVVL